VYEPSANEPRPLVVATHGAGGAPEGECAYWVRLTGGRAFVLSLRGTPFDQGAPSSFYYKNHLELGRELVAALQAARARYGSRLSPEGGLYSGFSQGATMGIGMIPAHGAELSHLVLIEGGYDYWSVAQAKKYRASGGQRVLFVCGTKWCADKSEKSATWLRQAGLEARVEYAPGVGHTPMGEVMDHVALALPWVVSGNPVWRLL
jgi:predicted esterase